MHHAKKIIGKTSILFISILISAFSSLGQTFLLSDFTEIDESSLPKFGYGDLYDIVNSSSTPFTVSTKDGKLVINKTQNKKPCELKLSNGKLVGENLGEWGGSLKFFPDDTSKIVDHICDGNLIFIFKCRNEIYFLEGLSNILSHSGSMYRLDTLNHTFKCTNVVDFEYPPEVYAIYNDTILVAHNGTIFVIKDSEKQIFHKTEIHFNSIAILNNSYLFLGMNGGYAKVDLKTNKRIFYLYPF